MDITDTQLSEARSALITLIAPHRGSEVMMRINSYVFEKTKLKLPEFLASDKSSNNEKHAIITELADIIKSGDYSKLPVAPTGQAQTPNAGAAAPAPAHKAPVAPKAPTPAPKPPAPAPVPEPAPEPVAAEEDPDVIELQLKLAQAKAAAAAKAKAAVPGLTADEVRAIIKDEFESDRSPVRGLINEAIKAAVDARVAAIFETIAGSLKEKK